MASSPCHLSHLQGIPSVVARSSVIELSAISPYHSVVVSHLTRSLTLTHTRCFTCMCTHQLWGILMAEGAEICHQTLFSPFSGVMVTVDVEVGAVCCPPAVINPAPCS